MSEWLEGTLADVCASIDYGLTASACEEPVGPKFLRITDIVGVSLDWNQVPFVPASASDSHKFKLHSGDIVIARTGATTGESRFIIDPPRAVFASYLVRLKINQQNNPRFISYWLKSPEFRNYLEGVLGDKSAQPNASASTMTRAPIRIPANVEKQHYIASMLGALDDKIELNRRMNKTLEAMARAIFKDWFVDFGPTRAKVEGRAPYLAPELWELFPDAMDGEDKPLGWQVRNLKAFLRLNYGKSLPARKRTPGNVEVYGSGGVTGTHNTALIEGPAVIVGRKGTVGSIYWENGPVFPIDTVFYVVPTIGSMLFSYHLLAAQPLRNMNTDAAVPGLNRDNAYRLEFPEPTPELILAFEDIVGTLWKHRANNLAETKTLAETRDLLLPKLMSGEIRLSEAEKAVDAVA